MAICAALAALSGSGAYGSVDAPELAAPGPFAIGLRTLRLVNRDQVDVLRYTPGATEAPRADRPLEVELWYPSRPTAHAPKVSYRAELPSEPTAASEPPAPPARFSFPGEAVRDAAPIGRMLPLVIVSHGYSNDPVLMTWLTENLASKGYVVAAIRHADPPIWDRTKSAEVLLRRPLDIAFAAATLKSMLAGDHLIDPTRVALVGYSIGGYGVLTAAGGELDPAGPLATTMIPGGLLAPYARGGALEDSILIKPLSAVVAISPAGGGPKAWGSEGLQGIHAPLLLIAGDADRTVDYQSGARTFFGAASNAPRYLLTYHLGGHALGLNGAPDAMRGRLWDQDWFEDPVWRKDRIIAINVHFITAFLDRYVKGDESRAAYLNVPVTDSSAGTWAQTQPPGRYDALSPGNGPGVDAAVTLWKGFQRNHAIGLELLHAGE